MVTSSRTQASSEYFPPTGTEDTGVSCDRAGTVVEPPQDYRVEIKMDQYRKSSSVSLKRYRATLQPK